MKVGVCLDWCVQEEEKYWNNKNIQYNTKKYSIKF